LLARARDWSQPHHALQRRRGVRARAEAGRGRGWSGGGGGGGGGGTCEGADGAAVAAGGELDAHGAPHAELEVRLHHAPPDLRHAGTRRGGRNQARAWMRAPHRAAHGPAFAASRCPAARLRSLASETDGRRFRNVVA
jgi:hypothetical protein